MKAVLQVLDGVGGKELPPLVDAHKARLGSGVVVLVSDAGGKAAIAAGVTSDLTGRVSAVDLARAASSRRSAAGAAAGGPRWRRRAARPPRVRSDALAAAAALLEGA